MNTRSGTPPVSPTTPAAQPAKPGPAHKWLVLMTVMAATFMAVLDATVVTVGLAKIIATFGVSIDEGEWILTGYLLVFGVVLPSSGWFADWAGHKKVFIFGIFLFTFGSLLSSLAWSINALIAFRIVQGAGAGFLLPVGLAIVTREFPPEKRGMVLGFWSISASASVALGPTIGGFLIDRYAWHSIFDVNIPIGIITIALSLFILKEHKAERIAAFDLLGFLSLSVFLTTLLLALADGNASWNTGGWTSKFILTCFAISAVSATIFFITELTIDNPMIDLQIFRNFNFSINNLVLFIFGFGLFGSTFLLPLYLQNSLGYTPLQAGLVFFPVGIIQSFTGPLGGFITDRFGGKLPAITGLSLLSISFFMNGFLSLYSEHSQIMFPLYIRGLGMGLIFAPLTTMALSDIERSKMAIASGLLNVIRQIGGSFGVAVFSSLLTSRTILHSNNYGIQVGAHPDVIADVSRTLGVFADKVTGGTAADISAHAQALIYENVQNQAFVQAVNDVFLVASFAIGLAVLPAIFGKSGKRRKNGANTAMEG